MRPYRSSPCLKKTSKLPQMTSGKRMTKKNKLKVMNIDHTLPMELIFIRHLIQYRLSAVQGQDMDEPVFPQPDLWQLNLIAFARQYQLSAEEIILLWIALTPHIKSDLFDEAIQQILKDSNDLPVLGGVRGKNFRGFIPTGETAIFLLAGENYQKRFQ